MQELQLSIDILKDIHENGTLFNEALKKKFQTDVSIRPLRKDVAGLVGCELRHDILFAFLLKDFGLGDDEYFAAALLLGDAYFYKRVSLEALSSAVKELVGEEKFAKVEPLLDKGGENPTYIPDDIKQGSVEYLSLRYNTPLWVLKIWNHFGYGNMYKSLRKNIRPSAPSLRARYSVLDKEVVENNPDFIKTAIEGIYAYQGKEPLRKLDWVRSGKMFVEKAGIKAIFDQYKISEPMEAFLYGNNDQALKELVESYGDSIGLNLGVSDSLDSHVEVSRLIKEKDLHNVNFFSAASDALEAYITRPQDLVIAMPSSSEFDSIRENPDFFVHLKQDSLDGLLSGQAKLLEDLAPHVAEHGKLVYLVLTMNKKEGHYAVFEFLKNHPEFNLEKEEQLFPYNGLDTTAYYAVLSKDPDLAKASPSVGGLDIAEAGEPCACAAKEE